MNVQYNNKNEFTSKDLRDKIPRVLLTQQIIREHNFAVFHLFYFTY